MVSKESGDGAIIKHEGQSAVERRYLRKFTTKGFILGSKHLSAKAQCAKPLDIWQQQLLPIKCWQGLTPTLKILTKPLENCARYVRRYGWASRPVQWTRRSLTLNGPPAGAKRRRQLPCQSLDCTLGITRQRLVRPWHHTSTLSKHHFP